MRKELAQCAGRADRPPPPRAAAPHPAHDVVQLLLDDVPVPVRVELEEHRLKSLHLRPREALQHRSAALHRGGGGPRARGGEPEASAGGGPHL